MPILLHADFIQDYSNDDKETTAPPSTTISYLVNATGELMEKDIKQRLALKERVEILRELKSAVIDDFEKERSNFKTEELRTHVCVDEEFPLKNCLMDFKSITSEKQFDHLISCYHHLDAYEACVRRNSG
ncbi:hypothetical protein BmR1_04g06045 [Babesia microti strain RI]|uniref:Uncharacterized protein n=1 Tax=Babesia microti (strain RI) TaxID=1133968 RepID=I7IH92_BABMR|nr:hypothetical protein BmR1_04g06045 [Babesia microti strain RI]CCF75407.1 hypothetical protein BmR1_04g06045 [Babesia microti strain RI]|eukprot:XP_012649815.1 hypothetical protein BmR1_04g06045 [Babesia microti strain RI]